VKATPFPFHQSHAPLFRNLFALSYTRRMPITTEIDCKSNVSRLTVKRENDLGAKELVSSDRDTIIRTIVNWHTYDHLFFFLSFFIIYLVAWIVYGLRYCGGYGTARAIDPSSNGTRELNVENIDLYSSARRCVTKRAPFCRGQDREVRPF